MHKKMSVAILTFAWLFIQLVWFSCLCSSNHDFAHDNPIRSLVAGHPDNFLLHPSFPSRPIKAIYQFGDSISDTGNLIRADPSINCAYWPYGESAFGKPTGRCSDGLLIIDYFAKFLNLSSIDAYLNKDGNFTQGVNFAVGGATALNVSTLEDKYNITSPTNLSLPVQLGWFKSHLHSIYPNASARRRNLAKGLFFMGEIGGNDYNFAFFQPNNTIQNVYNMVPLVVQAIRNAVEEIIELGATQIVVPGNFPIGCMPIYLSLFKTNDSKKYDKMKCLKAYNKHAEFHNEHIRRMIRDIRKSRPNVTIAYMDYFGTLKDILRHPTHLGFDEDTIQEACCGAADNEYRVKMNVYCGNEGVPVCENPRDHVSWDGTHLTQQAYHIIASRLMRHSNGVGNLRIFGHSLLIVICIHLILGF